MTDPYYTDDSVTLFHGDCLDVLRDLPAESVDSVCTDPPYGLEFMGREWDAPWKGDVRQRGDDTFDAADDSKPFGRIRHGGTAAYGASAAVVGAAFQAWCTDWAAECLRVLKPGGHMLAFGGSRTWHRLTCAVEDAGFEIRDSIAWLYGSGFPKSLDVSKAIDKAAGAEREDVYADTEKNMDNEVYGKGLGVALVERRPATPDAQKWQGWGTALKPAFEPIVVARKPLAGTVSQNVLAYGTGAFNVDGCRVESGSDYHELSVTQGGKDGGGFDVGSSDGTRHTTFQPAAGRWPSNVVLDDSQATELDQQSGTVRSAGHYQRGPTSSSGPAAIDIDRDGYTTGQYDDSGGASRFFPTFKYEPKAPTTERPRENGTAHPTVKPLDLMRWLVRLVTPPGGVVLEPFAGSGTTAEACVVEGFQCIAIEREADYLPLIVQRLTKPIQVALEFD